MSGEKLKMLCLVNQRRSMRTDDASSSKYPDIIHYVTIFRDTHIDIVIIANIILIFVVNLHFIVVGK